MVSEKLPEAVLVVVSFTWIVTIEVPSPEGVPLITPLLDRLSPVGKDPAVTDHV